MMFFWTVLTLFSLAVQAKNWNAQELAVGEWEVTLMGGWFFDPSSIFPRQSLRDHDRLPIKRKPWGSSLDCSLSLCQDGTFVLTPKKGSTSRRLAIRGHWDVLSNPYCITDRFYDQLRLKSYPRKALNAQHKKGISLVGSWDLNCRVWGRHNKSITLGRKGWMTHGALVWKDAKKTLLHPRRIVASFSAKRVDHQPQHDGWEDQEFFRY